MPLKYPSQRATDHSGTHTSSAVYFPLPKKGQPFQLCPSMTLLIALDSYRGQLGWMQVHSWCAQESETHAGTCSEEHPPHWDVHGREQPGNRWLEGQRDTHTHPFTCTDPPGYCTVLQLPSGQKEATAQGKEGVGDLQCHDVEEEARKQMQVKLLNFFWSLTPSVCVPYPN